MGQYFRGYSLNLVWMEVHIRYLELHEDNGGMIKFHLSEMGNRMFCMDCNRHCNYLIVIDSNVKVLLKVGQNEPWQRYD